MAFWRRHRIFRALILTVLGAFIVIAALPLWFPWLLRPLARHWEVTYAHYEKKGYQHFLLTDVTLAGQSGRFQAKQVEALVPTVWLWRCITGFRSRSFLTVESWRWNYGSPAPRKTSSSAYRELQTAGTKIHLLKKCLPKAELRNGSLQLNKESVEIAHALWTDGKLSADLSAPRFGRTNAFHLIATAPSVAPMKLNLNLDATGFHFQSHVTVAAITQGVKVLGTASWLGNRIELSALIPHRGFRPKTASLQADSFDIPARLLKLEHYRNLTGSLLATWQTGRFNLILNARAAPRSANGMPIELKISASGNTHSAQIKEARISAPGLEATLSTPAGILFKPPYMAQPATLNLKADLAKQPWVSLTGKLDGKAILQPQTARLPPVTFNFSGSGISSSNITARSLALSGNIRWPLAESVNLRVDHLEIPHARPLHLEAHCQGRGMDLEELQLALNARNSSLQMRGSAHFGGKKKTLNLTALDLNLSNRTELQLKKPFEVTFQKNPATSSNAWTFRAQPFAWSGPGGELQVSVSTEWPATGAFRISARDLDCKSIQDFIQSSIPRATIRRLDFAGEWTNSPVDFHLNSTTEWKTRDRNMISIQAAVQSATNGISIQHLSLSSKTQVVCQVHGVLPMMLEPAGTKGFLRVNEAGGLRLHAVTQTNSAVWNDISRMSGVLLSKPHLQLDIHGTLKAPQGRIALQAQHIRFPRIKHALPGVDDLHLIADINPNKLHISQLRFKLQGQPVQFTANVPIHESFRSMFTSEKRLPDWRKATAHLVIEKADLAPFVKLAPAILSPQGVVQANVTLHPGGTLNGALTISDAATLPLASLGSIQNIHVAIAFLGQTAELTNFNATIGGEPLAATGRMPLNLQALRGFPPFFIHIRGTNVPIVRKPNLLLRANLDLGLTNSNSGQGLVAGNVTLEDGLFMADLESLIPANTSRPAEHPPYFSVNASPWAAWRLNVQVRGRNFMRVRTPVFQGAVSATLKLDNTLENPLAIGEIHISSGAVTFPFGSLHVKQGFVSLTSDNPYHPRLFISAQTEQFGYTVKLEVTGTADKPIVQFSSTPPLSSQQIVMMLTTGQLPAGIGVSTSTLQRAEGLGMFFGRNLLSEFGLGLSGQNRLTFHSGQQISDTGRATYQVDYRISKRWSIIGEYDRFDQYNLNLKWNIYSK